MDEYYLSLPQLPSDNQTKEFVKGKVTQAAAVRPGRANQAVEGKVQQLS